MSINNEVFAFLNSYRAAFESLDPPAIAAFWHPPTLALEQSGARSCTTHQELIDAFSSVVKDFRAADFWEARYELREVKVLREDLLELNTHWRLVNRRDELIKLLHNIYVLRRVKGVLKIAAVYLLG